MKKTYWILIMFLLSCLIDSKDEEQINSISANVTKQTKIEKDAIIEIENKYSKFYAKLENKLIRYYITYYKNNSKKRKGKYEDVRIADVDFQFKIYRNKNDIEFDIQNSPEYFYEISKYENNLPEILLKGDYVTLFHDGEPHGLTLFSKTFFIVENNMLYIYQFAYPFAHGYKAIVPNEGWAYILKKDSYFINSGNLILLNKEIYAEDYDIVYKMLNNFAETEQYDFKKASDKYILKVNEKYSATFVPKDTLYQEMLSFILEDFNTLVDDNKVLISPLPKSSQSNKQTLTKLINHDYEREKLFNQVKSMIILESKELFDTLTYKKEIKLNIIDYSDNFHVLKYDFNSDGQQTIMKGWNNKRLSVRKEYEYNRFKKINLIREIHFDKCGDTSQYLYNYFYDDTGNLIEEENFYIHKKYKYNDSGSLIEKFEEVYEPAPMYKVLYDNKGEIIEAYVLNYDSTINTKVVYQNIYDSNGNIKIQNAQHFDYMYEFDGLTSYIYEYDNSNNLIEEKVYNNNILELKYKYKYDKCFNLTEELEERYYDNGELSDRKVIKYKYDKYNNWIYKIEHYYDEYSSHQESVIYRFFEYFEQK